MVTVYGKCIKVTVDGPREPRSNKTSEFGLEFGNRGDDSSSSPELPFSLAENGGEDEEGGEGELEDLYTPSVIPSYPRSCSPLSSPPYSLLDQSMPLQPYWGSPFPPSPTPLLLPPYQGAYTEYPHPLHPPDLTPLAPTYCLPHMPAADYEVIFPTIITPPIFTTMHLVTTLLTIIRKPLLRTSPSPRPSPPWPTLTRA